MIRAILLSLAGSLFLPAQLCAQSAWTYFHPESVIGTDCRVIRILVYGNDGKFDAEVYKAIASAKRNLNPPDDLWEQDIARFPLTQKGSRKAAIACSDWSHEAHKRIQAARLLAKDRQ